MLFRISALDNFLNNEKKTHKETKKTGAKKTAVANL